MKYIEYNFSSSSIQSNWFNSQAPARGEPARLRFQLVTLISELAVMMMDDDIDDILL